MKPRILFVEDDDTLRPVLERELRASGHDVTSCASAEQALEFLETHKVDVGLLDLRLPGMSGLELLRAIKDLDAELPVVFLTGHGSLAEAVEAMRAGAFDFLAKPAPLDELELVLERAIEHGALIRKNHLLRSLVNRGVASEILGDSKVMVDLRTSIGRIAHSDASVLIVGESGTGKELVARAIHEASPRSEAAFVVVNCGAIPQELFESELFGHTRGAFTGASHRRLGLLELAEGGTLFLDEVGELPLAVQPALLRAVQFGEFRPVGSERSQVADVRVLAATNRELTECVELKEFREDLYHRIATFVVPVAPLREREGDLPLLALALLEQHNEKVPAELVKRFSPAALDRMRAHEWTGNVRELENVVIRLVTLVDGAEIEAADVERQLRPAGGDSQREFDSLDLETLERAAVLQALRRHQGKRKPASAELGVSVKTLYNKIREHMIVPSEWDGSAP